MYEQVSLNLKKISDLALLSNPDIVVESILPVYGLCQINILWLFDRDLLDGL